MDPRETELLRAALAATQTEPWRPDELAQIASTAMATDRPETNRVARDTSFGRYTLRGTRTSGIRGAVWALAGSAAIVAALLFVFLSPSSPAASHMQTYATQRAQHGSFQLPDGSTAVLGPATTLRYIAQPDGQRIVELDGQAYFTVSHDPARQFAVTAGGVTTRVLGTAFAVRAYETDSLTQVAVAQGKVAMETSAGDAVLLAGDVATARSATAPALAQDVSVATVFGWMRGQVMFDDTPLARVALELQRMYDLDIQIKGTSLAQRPVTMTINNKSATAVLDAIALAVDATYRRNGNTVIFSPRGHP